MKNKLIWLEVALLTAPFVALAMLWKELPPRVPIHWNLRGEIDGWASKPSMLAMPLISVGIVAVLHLMPRFDPKLRRSADNQGRMKSVLGILGLTLAAFFAAIFSIQVAAALGHPMPASRMVPASILLLLTVFGNYSANLRPNYFAGLRTPWTLESPATWRATHRLGGRLLFFGSITLLVLQFFVSESVFFILFMTSVLALVVWAFWYSWHHFHTQEAMPLSSSGE